MGRDDLVTWLRLKGLGTYKQGLKDAERSTEGFGRVGTGISQRLKLGWLAVGTAISGAFVGITKNVVNLEHKMSEVWTLIEVGEKQIKSLSDGLRDLSIQVPKSAADLAAGMYDMISAGLEWENSLKGVGLAAKSATAGVTDVSTAVQAGMGVLNAYQMSVHELERVYDVQFATVKQGVLKYEELAHAMGNVIPTASTLGIEIEELFGAIAFLTTQSQRADIATTNLNAMLSAFIERSEELKDIGVHVYDLEGNFRSLEAIVRDLGEATAGTTERRMTMLKAVKVDNIRALRAMLPMLKLYDKLGEKIEFNRQSVGLMGEAFEKMNQDAVSSAKRFGSAMATIFAPLGGLIKGIGARVADPISKAIEDSIQGGKLRQTIDSLDTLIDQALAPRDPATIPQIHERLGDLVSIRDRLDDLLSAGEAGDLWDKYGITLDQGELTRAWATIELLDAEIERLKELNKYLAKPVKVTPGSGISERLEELGISPGWKGSPLRGVNTSFGDVGFVGPPVPGDQGKLPAVQELYKVETATQPDLSGVNDLEEGLDAAAQATYDFNHAFDSLVVDGISEGMWAFEQFGSTVLGNANKAGEAFGQMGKQMLAMIGQLIARLIMLSIVSAFLPTSWGTALTGMSPSTLSRYNPKNWSGGTNKAPPAPSAPDQMIQVQVHEATPETWVQVVTGTIEPILSESKRRRITEDD